MTEQPRQRRAVWALSLLLLTALPWQTNLGPTTAPQESGAVELAKLVTAALGVALALSARTRERGKRLGDRLVPALLILYAAASALGALTGEHLTTDESAQRALRYAVVVVAVFIAARTAGLDRLLRLLTGFAVFQAAAALTAGLAGVTPRYDGRLAGALPPMHPNALALLVALGIAAALARLSKGTIAPRRLVPAILLLVPVLVLTGSRTSLVAAAASLLALLALGASTSQRLLVAWGTITGGVTLALVDSFRGSDTLEALATRGASAGIDFRTLTGRTDAWEVAFGTHRGVNELAFGAGLAEKTVVVPNSFAPFQVVDGSWAAAYLQAGWVGLTLMTCAVVVIAGQASRRSRPAALLLITLLPIAFVESQLNDVAYGLVVLVALSGVLSQMREPQARARPTGTARTTATADQARPATSRNRTMASTVQYDRAPRENRAQTLS